MVKKMAKGVTVTERSYKVRLSVGGKQYTIGKFGNSEEADELYEKAKIWKDRSDNAARRMFEVEMLECSRGSVEI
jgi:hypothetical protein